MAKNPFLDLPAIGEQSNPFLDLPEANSIEPYDPGPVPLLSDYESFWNTPEGQGESKPPATNNEILYGGDQVEPFQYNEPENPFMEAPDNLFSDASGRTGQTPYLEGRGSPLQEIRRLDMIKSLGVDPATPEYLEASSRANTVLENGYDPGVLASMGHQIRGGLSYRGGASGAFAALGDASKRLADAVGHNLDPFMEGLDDPIRKASSWLQDAGSQNAVAAAYDQIMAEKGRPGGLAGETVAAIAAIPDMGMTVLLTALSKNPNIGLSAMGIQVAADTYGRSRYIEGKDEGAAAWDALKDAAWEVAPEKMFGVLEPIASKLPIWKTILKTAVAEAPSEMVTEGLSILDEIHETGRAPSWLDQVVRVGKAGYAGGVMGLAMGGGGGVIRTAHDRLNQNEYSRKFDELLASVADETARRNMSPSGGQSASFDEGFNAADEILNEQGDIDKLAADLDSAFSSDSGAIPLLNTLPQLGDIQQSQTAQVSPSIGQNIPGIDLMNPELDQQPAETPGAEPVETGQLDLPGQKLDDIESISQQIRKLKQTSGRKFNMQLGIGHDKQTIPIDTLKDDILTTLAKRGGLNRDAWISEGIDPEVIKDKKLSNRIGAKTGIPFGKPLMRATGGMTPEDVAEFLRDERSNAKEGFAIPPEIYDQHGNVSANDALQFISQVINGTADGRYVDAIALDNQISELEGTIGQIEQQRADEAREKLIPPEHRAQAEIEPAHDPDYYPQEWDSEARSLADWMAVAEEAGVTDEVMVMASLKAHTHPADAVKELLNGIQEIERRGRQETTTDRPGDPGARPEDAGTGLATEAQNAEAETAGTEATSQEVAPARSEQTPSTESATQLHVKWGNKSFPVESVEDAANKWDQFRTESGAGASEIGGAQVVDGNGNFVAKISYNGRAWGKDNKPYSEPKPEALGDVGTFKRRPNGKLVGYRVDLAEHAYKVGDKVRTSRDGKGKGTYVGSSEQYVKDYYAGSEYEGDPVEYLTEIEFDESEVVEGRLEDAEPEILIGKGLGTVTKITPLELQAEEPLDLKAEKPADSTTQAQPETPSESRTRKLKADDELMQQGYGDLPVFVSLQKSTEDRLNAIADILPDKVAGLADRRKRLKALKGESKHRTRLLEEIENETKMIAAMRKYQAEFGGKSEASTNETDLFGGMEPEQQNAETEDEIDARLEKEGQERHAAVVEHIRGNADGLGLKGSDYTKNHLKQLAEAANVSDEGSNQEIFERIKNSEGRKRGYQPPKEAKWRLEKEKEQRQALRDMADEYRAIGNDVMADMLESRSENTTIDVPQELVDFNRKKLEEHKRVASGDVPAPNETDSFDIKRYFETEAETKVLDDAAKLTEFDDEVADFLARINAGIKDRVKQINDLGYEVNKVHQHPYDAPNNKEARDLKLELSSIAGSGAKFLRQKVVMARKYKTASKEKVDAARNQLLEALGDKGASQGYDPEKARAIAEEEGFESVEGFLTTSYTPEGMTDDEIRALYPPASEIGVRTKTAGMDLDALESAHYMTGKKMPKDPKKKVAWAQAALEIHERDVAKDIETYEAYRTGAKPNNDPNYGLKMSLSLKMNHITWNNTAIKGLREFLGTDLFGEETTTNRAGGDLLGQDTSKEQSLADLQRAKDEKRSGRADKETVPMESGAGELFAGQQTPDLFAEQQETKLKDPEARQKAVAQSESQTSGRAKPGGEIGINGEFYQGGQFLPASKDTVKGEFKAKGGKARDRSMDRRLIAPGLYDVPPSENAKSIFGQLQLFVMRADGTRDAMDANTKIKVQPRIAKDENFPWSYHGFESLAEVEALVDQYNKGNRWRIPAEDQQSEADTEAAKEQHKIAVKKLAFMIEEPKGEPYAEPDTYYQVADGIDVNQALKDAGYMQHSQDENKWVSPLGSTLGINYFVEVNGQSITVKKRVPEGLEFTDFKNTKNIFKSEAEAWNYYLSLPLSEGMPERVVAFLDAKKSKHMGRGKGFEQVEVTFSKFDDIDYRLKKLVPNNQWGGTNPQRIFKSAWEKARKEKGKPLTYVETADVAKKVLNKGKYRDIAAKFKAENENPAVWKVDKPGTKRERPLLSRKQTVEWTNSNDSHYARLDRSSQIYSGENTTSQDRNVFEVARVLHNEAIDVWGGDAAYTVGVRGEDRGNIIITPADREIIVENMLGETLKAYRHDPTAVEWYHENLAEAIEYAAIKYPELKTDKDAVTAFKFILAITSNGQRVNFNAQMTDRLYEKYRKTKRFSVEGSGKEKEAMKIAFEAANATVNRLGWDKFVEFLHTEYTVRELQDAGFAVNGENMETRLFGSAVFGPKVGGGFYQNLTGNYEPVTFDKWWMRTWGRHTGTLLPYADRMVKQKVKLRAMLSDNKATVYRHRYKIRELQKDDEKLIDFALKVQSEYAKSNFTDKTPLNKYSNTVAKTLEAIKEAPGNGSEREFMRSIVEDIQTRLADMGIDMFPADIQALLWYAEKDLYDRMGRATDLTRNDYASAWQEITGSPKIQRSTGGSADPQNDSATGGRGSGKTSEKQEGQTLRSKANRAAPSSALSVEQVQSVVNQATTTPKASKIKVVNSISDINVPGLVPLMTAWHGTPHSFDKFSLDNIGGGEGAQAYGWGLYFAESQGLANAYRVNLSYDPSQMKVGGEQINDYFNRIGDRAARMPVKQARGEYEKLELLERLMMNDLLADVAEAAKEMSAETQKWFNKEVKPGFETYGNLYEVDIPDSVVEKMLDWDKPLKDQPAHIQSAIKKIDPPSRRIEDMSREELIGQLEKIDPNGTFSDDDSIAEFGEVATKEELLESARNLELQDYLDENANEWAGDENGRSLYYWLTSKFGGTTGGNAYSNDAQAQASEYLASIGIPGIKYFDGNSRSVNVVDKRLDALLTKHKDDAEAAVDEFMQTVHESPKEKAKMRETLLDEIRTKTRNFVVFNAENAKIKTRNGQPLPSKPLHSEKQGGIEGMYDPESDTIYLIADQFSKEDRVKWVTWHELWHRGARVAFGDHLDNTLRNARTNPFVNRLANKVYQDRKFADEVKAGEFTEARAQLIATDEALAELDAAAQSGNFEHIEQRYKVKVPAGLQAGWRKVLADWIEAVKRIFNKIGISNQEVRSILNIGSEASGGDMPGRGSSPAMASEGNSKDPFYSALTETVEAAEGMPKKGRPAEFKKWLDGQQKKGKLKKEERDWIGLDEWLDSKESVTRTELQQFVRDNQVSVEEVVKGGYTPDESEIEVYMDDEAGEGLSREEAIENLIQQNYDEAPPTKFESYTLPGGKNYRELLLTLPYKNGKPSFEQWNENREFLGDKPGTLEEYNDDVGWYNQRGSYAQENTYKSGHYDEPNILAHIRFNERKGANGERILFIEEIQSDWHQAGRKGGYKDDNREEAVKELEELNKIPEGKRTKLQWKKLHRAKNIAYGSPVPGAPFKKTWPMLAMKRMLRYATENGFDSVAWTTGEQQAERYDLSKQIDEILVVSLHKGKDVTLFPNRDTDPNGGDPIKLRVNDDGTVDKRQTDPHPSRIVSEVIGKHITDVVGKDVGDLIMETSSSATLKGDDLKVGGEGMRSFYDRTLVNETNKFVRKWGGKVKETAIGSGAYELRDGMWLDPHQTEVEQIAGADYDSIFKGWMEEHDFDPDLWGHPDDILANEDVELTPAQEGFLRDLSTDIIEAEETPENWALTDGEGYIHEGGFATRREAMQEYDRRTTKQAKKGSMDKQPGLEITDQMREAIRGGVPMFSKKDGGNVIDFPKQPERLKPYTETKKSNIDYDKFIRDNDIEVMPQGDTRAKDGKIVPDFVEIELDGITASGDTLEEAVDDLIGKFERGGGELEIPTKKEKPLLSRAPQLNFNPDFSAWSLPTLKLSEAMKDQSLSTMDKALKGTENLRLNARQWAQDKMIPLRRIQEQIEKTGGLMNDFSNVYDKEQLLSGRVEDRFKEMEGEDLAPLVSWMSKHGVSRETLGRYLYARHAEARNDRIAEVNANFPDGGSGMSTAEAKRILADFDQKGLTPALKKMAGYVDRITNKTRNNFKEYGLINSEVIKDWEKPGDFNDTYVPLRGFADAIKEEFGRPGKGFDIRGEESRRALGRKSEPGDIIGHVLSAYKLSVIRGEKNRVGQALLKLVIDNPNPNLWKVNPVKMKTVIDKKTGMTKEVVDLQLNDPNVFYTKVKGKAYRIELRDPRLAIAMKNLGADNMGAIMRGLSTTTRYLSMTRTMLSPEFIVTNFMRDIQTAAINLTGEQAKAIRKTAISRKSITHSMRAMFNEQRDGSKGDPVWRRYAREYTEDGGRVAFFRAESVEELARKVDRMNRMAGKGAGKALFRGLKATFEMIEDLNLAVENATRLSAYKAARENGMSRQKAAVLAKNLTVNFNRKGLAGPQVNAMYMFANASMQGAQRMLQASKNPRVQKVLLASALFGTLMTVLNQLSGGDDDDGESFYSKVPDFEKSRKFILMIPQALQDYVKDLPFMKFVDKDKKRGAYLSFHLPYGYSVPYVMGEAIGSTAFGTDPADAGINILLAINNSFNPVGGSNGWTTIAPTLADPFVELLLNRNFWGGPIHQAENVWDDSPAPNSSQGWRNTNAAYKYVAKKLNEWSGGNEARPGAIDLHPETYRHFLEFATGGTGSFVERVIDNVSAAVSPNREVDINRVPFVRQFYGTTRDFADVDRYYSNVAELEYLKDEDELFMEKVQKGEMRQDRYDQWKEDRKDLFEAGLIGEAKATESAIRKLRKHLKKEREQDPLSEAAKEIEKRILDRQRDFNKKFNDVMLDKGWLRSIDLPAPAPAKETTESGVSHKTVEQVASYEQYRGKAYKRPGDAWTVGFGTNIEEPHARDWLKELGKDPAKVIAGEQTISKPEATILLHKGLDLAVEDARKLFNDFDLKPEPVKRILTDMSYNLGYNRLKDFTNFRKAVDKEDYKEAAWQMRYSRTKSGKVVNTPWYLQTGRRSRHLTSLMESQS